MFFVVLRFVEALLADFALELSRCLMFLHMINQVAFTSKTNSANVALELGDFSVFLHVSLEV
jgi:hypothetical protein